MERLLQNRAEMVYTVCVAGFLDAVSKQALCSYNSKPPIVLKPGTGELQGVALWCRCRRSAQRIDRSSTGAPGAGLKVYGLGFEVQGLAFRVWGLWFMV